MTWLSRVWRFVTRPAVYVGGFLLLLLHVVRNALGRRERLPLAQSWLDPSVPAERAEKAKEEVTARTVVATRPHFEEIKSVDVAVEAARVADRAKRRAALRQLAKKVDQVSAKDQGNP